MSFKSQIEQGLEQIQQMQELYRQVREAEILPLSFFSTAYDTLKSLTVSLHEMESAQLNAMLQQSSKHESMFAGINMLLRKPEPEINLDDFVKLDTQDEQPSQEKQDCEIIVPNETPNFQKEKEILQSQQSAAFLNDILSKQLATDLRKVISLNDRFRFQKDLFNGNAKLMDDILDQLNGFTSLNDVLIFLNNNFSWNWEEEPASDFRIILEKRFS
ncbi:hypothetical protein FACS1894174_06660 [Bacteroidia bacterium]|nr:hypothetical protein FACS1894203_1830 [Bacteroidia bacterium]GHV22261.1 hypothetical protein FACS1894174_06660 [Bacteroidia bacterium]